MVIYIHGFGTSGLGGKGTQFREYFKSIGEPFIAPSLSYVPELAIATLEELVNSYDNVKLMGSSLGGYYAMHLAEKYKLKAILITLLLMPLKFYEMQEQQRDKPKIIMTTVLFYGKTPM